MSIEIILVRENPPECGDVTVFFKFEVKGELVEWHADIPLGKDPQAHLEAMEDDLVFLALNKVYDRADWIAFQEEDLSRLESMEAWISAGHKNQVGGFESGEEPIYKVIEKQPWRSTHPSSLATLKLIEDANLEDKNLEKLLKDIHKEK